MTKETIVDHFRMMTIETKNCSHRHIIFLHGGAYVCEANLVHRMMAEKFADRGFRVTAFDYPMAPEHTAVYTNQWIVTAYKELINRYPDDVFYVFGDSAGGGLSVIFLMLLRDQGIQPVPQKSVLASPWLDVSMSNPEIECVYKNDIMLSYDALVYTGKEYAGKLGTTSPYVSPIYGNLNDLGEILMFYSSNEIFVPDFEKFVQLIRQAIGTSITAHKEEGLFHCYLMWPTLRQSKEAFAKMVAFLK